MILPDVNLVVYAHNAGAARHEAAKSWWRDLLSSDEPVGIPWVVALGFIRIVTHRAALVTPLEASSALRLVRSWFGQPNVQVLEPGPLHLEILERLFRATGVAASLTSDAHLAAIAIEHQCELNSSDTDFARFPGLRWRNPL